MCSGSFSYAGTLKSLILSRSEWIFFFELLLGALYIAFKSNHYLVNLRFESNRSIGGTGGAQGGMLEPPGNVK